LGVPKAELSVYKVSVQVTDEGKVVFLPLFHVSGHRAPGENGQSRAGVDDVSSNWERQGQVHQNMLEKLLVTNVDYDL
jgi:hypothetical protein